MAPALGARISITRRELEMLLYPDKTAAIDRAAAAR